MLELSEVGLQYRPYYSPLNLNLCLCLSVPQFPHLYKESIVLPYKGYAKGQRWCL